MPASWTWIDYGFVVIVAFSTVFALTKGVTRELISLAALIGGFVLAAHYYSTVGGFLGDYTRTQTVADLIGFLAIFLSIILAGFVVGHIADRGVKVSSLGWCGRFVGGGLGFVCGG